MIKREGTSVGEVDALNIVANREMKGLTYMGLVDAGEISVRGLSVLMSELAGHEFSQAYGGYLRIIENYGFSQSRRSINNQGRPTTVYEPSNEAIAIPMIGTTLEWARDSEIPLRRVLTDSLGTKTSKGPRNSIDILSGILDDDDPTDIESNYSQGDIHNSALNGLTSEGIVVKKDMPRSRIINPIYNGNMPFESLKPIRQHIYTALVAAEALSPDARWTVDELVDFVYSMHPNRERMTELEKSDLREIVWRGMDKDCPTEFSRTLEQVDMKRGRLVVSPQYLDAVSTLVEKVRTADDATGSTKNRLADAAYDIYFDRPTVAQLIERDRSFEKLKL